MLAYLVGFYSRVRPDQGHSSAWFEGGTRVPSDVFVFLFFLLIFFGVLLQTLAGCLALGLEEKNGMFLSHTRTCRRDPFLSSAPSNLIPPPGTVSMKTLFGGGNELGRIMSGSSSCFMRATEREADSRMDAVWAVRLETHLHSHPPGGAKMFWLTGWLEPGPSS